jgi:hypothetical protein
VKNNADISVRLNQLIEYVGIKPAQFANKLGYKRAQAVYDMQNGKAKPSFDFFEKLLRSEYSELINLRWLILGDGDMINDEVAEEREKYGETKCELCKGKEREINRLEKINDALLNQLDRCNADLDEARTGQKKKAV